MADPITVTDLTQAGRLQAPDPNQPRVFVTYNADFALAADITLDFTIINQQQVFGIPRAMFIDNGSNESEVEVAVSGTDQYFTVPPYAQGVFKIDAQLQSRINFVTAGGATDKVTITIYNWEVSPAVWYRFGAFNKDVPIKAQGAMNEGDTVAAEPSNNPVYIGGIDRATGLFHGIAVDGQGRLDFSSSITIGSVTISAPSAGSIGNVAASVTSVQLLAANVNRKGAIILNDSTSILQIALDNVDAATTYSIVLQAGESFTLGNGDYTGDINGAWASATGQALVTELT